MLACSCLLATDKAFASSLDASKIVSGTNVKNIQATEDEISITLDKTSFNKKEYILADWFDKDENKYDDINVFGQRIDCVQYVLDGDNVYWDFDTEGDHGVIVEISNSEDASVEPVTYEIGTCGSHTNKVPAFKGALYDTIEFSPYKK